MSLKQILRWSPISWLTFVTDANGATWYWALNPGEYWRHWTDSGFPSTWLLIQRLSDPATDPPFVTLRFWSRISKVNVDLAALVLFKSHCCAMQHKYPCRAAGWRLLQAFFIVSPETAYIFPGSWLGLSPPKFDWTAALRGAMVASLKIPS